MFAILIFLLPVLATSDPRQDSNLQGVAVNITDYPYQVSLQYENIHVCSGAIVSPKTVVTVVQCLEKTEDCRHDSLYTVRAGSEYHDKGGQVVPVQVCLILKRALVLGPEVAVISLQPKEVEVDQGVEASITGWGKSECTDANSGPKHKQLHVVKKTMKASESYTEGCTADLGAPAVVSGKLVGIRMAYNYSGGSGNFFRRVYESDSSESGLEVGYTRIADPDINRVIKTVISDGAIVAPRVVATSDKCLHVTNNCVILYTVRAGSSYHDEGGQIVPVQKCRSAGNIGVVILAEALKLGPKVALIPLEPEGANLPYEFRANITGWNTLGPVPKQLHAKELTVSCWGLNLNDHMIQEYCLDAGAPLVVTGKLAGIMLTYSKYSYYCTEIDRDLSRFIKKYSTATSFPKPSKSWEGKVVKIEDHPYQVSLHHKGSYVCGGSIVSPRTVLTAVQCLKEANDSRCDSLYTVRAGSCSFNKGGQVVPSWNCYKYPNGSMANPYLYMNSVGIVILKTALKLGPRVAPIPLQPPFVKVRTETTAIITGWGNSECTDGASRPKLRQLHAVEVTKIDCSESIYRNEAFSDCFILHREGQKICTADLGAPVVVKGELVGIKMITGDRITYTQISSGRIGYDIKMAIADPEYDPVVRGTLVNIEYHPYQVSLQHNNSHVCGGAIVSLKVVVTANTCLKETEDSRCDSLYTVRAGSSYRDAGGQVIPTQNCYRIPHDHPNSADNSIGIVVLKKALKLGPGVAVIPLQPEQVKVPFGVKVNITAWGWSRYLNLKLLHVTEIIRNHYDDYESADKPFYYLSFEYDNQYPHHIGLADVGAPLVAAGKLVGIVMTKDFKYYTKIASASINRAIKTTISEYKSA